MSGNKNILGKAVFAGFVLLIIWLLSSCTTIRNAERRHDRIVKNFPSVHQSDTIEVERIVTVEIEGFRDSNIFIFDTITKEPIYDTIYFQNSIMVVNTIWRERNGQNKLKTDIVVPTRIITKTIKEKQPIVYVNRPLKWFQIKWVVFLLFFLGFAIGYLLRKTDNNFFKGL
jgi:hypothetical protein